MTLPRAPRAAALAAALLSSSPVLASSAAPTLAVDKSFGKVAGWSIGYSQSAGGCLAAARYGDGTTVWFGFGGARNNAYLAFTNARWRSVEPGQSYDLHLRARGGSNWHGSFAGFDHDGERGLFESGLTDKFIADLSEAGGLSVEWDGRQIASLSLVGSSDALAAVVGCQKDGAVTDSKSDAGAPEAKGEDRSGSDSQGTGFYVSDRGHVLTNNHVVDGCRTITITHLGSASVPARLVAKDSVNDLAVLSTDLHQDVVPPLSMRARVGESVFAYGYPMNGLLATSGNFTIGNVTATAGLGDDTGHIQISAPVQPGNSGGPLLDRYGKVVGVIQSKLNALKVASVTSDLPQNVNFAIKSTVALNFLDANGISAPLDARTTEPMDGEAIAERAKAFTVRVNCH